MDDGGIDTSISRHEALYMCVAGLTTQNSRNQIGVVDLWVWARRKKKADANVHTLNSLALYAFRNMEVLGIECTGDTEDSRAFLRTNDR